MNKPKIIFLPHANIQYSQLAPEKRQWVMKNCYEKLFDLIADGDYKIAFEASGITIDEMAKQAPEVLAKLRKLVQEGKVEPVCSPYIHFMLSNIPKEVCLHSLRYSMDVWEKHTGKRPEIGWNPECGWAGYIPDVYKEAGLKALIMDADSLMLSFDEIRRATGLEFDVQGHSNKNHLFKIEEYIKDKPEFLKFITNTSVAPNGLKMIFRSDCMTNLLLWYLMGATEGMREEPINMGEIKNMLENWKGRIAETGSFIMPYAEDAEYIGSSAYFYVKQFNQARFFEEEPDSVKRFKEILDAAKDAGYEFVLPSEVLDNTIENEYVDNIENGVAWHGGTAKAWANTEYSRIMDPVCISILNGIKAVAEKIGQDLASLDSELDNAMKALASAWVSDSRWPPAPTSPGRFNVRESLEDMYLANDYIQKAMEKAGIAEKRGLYSPNLMKTQIKAIDDLLMSKEYFCGMMKSTIKHVHFQLTRNCNLRCPFCGQWGKKGFFAGLCDEEMTFEDFNRIIGELEEYRDKTGISPLVTLWGGEPLVCEFFDDIAVSLKEKRFSTELITNGTGINEHKAVIKSCIDKVYVSIDGDRKTHNSIRGCGVFERVSENLKELCHDNVTVMSVITPALINNLQKFFDELSELGIKELFLHDMIGLRGNEIAEYKRLMKNVFGIDAKDIEAWESAEDINFSKEIDKELKKINLGKYPFAIVRKEHTDRAEFVCKAPFSHVHIAWNGNVLFCTDFYDFSAGNVKSDTLIDIFENEKSEKFRRQIENNNCPTCRHCSWRMN